MICSTQNIICYTIFWNQKKILAQKIWVRRANFFSESIVLDTKLFWSQNWQTCGDLLSAIFVVLSIVKPLFKVWKTEPITAWAANTPFHSPNLHQKPMFYSLFWGLPYFTGNYAVWNYFIKSIIFKSPHFKINSIT